MYTPTGYYLMLVYLNKHAFCHTANKRYALFLHKYNFNTGCYCLAKRINLFKISKNDLFTLSKKIFFLVLTLFLASTCAKVNTMVKTKQKAIENDRVVNANDVQVSGRKLQRSIKNDQRRIVC